jgi:hypothetical protein
MEAKLKVGERFSDGVLSRAWVFVGRFKAFAGERTSESTRLGSGQKECCRPSEPFHRDLLLLREASTSLSVLIHAE